MYRLRGTFASQSRINGARGSRNGGRGSVVQVSKAFANFVQPVACRHVLVLHSKTGIVRPVCMVGMPTSGVHWIRRIFLPLLETPQNEVRL
jgi:hypothetical protein